MVLAMTSKPWPILALIALALLGAPQTASAAEGGGHEAAPPSSGSGADKPEEGNSVILPTLIAPMVEGPRLAGYLYLSVRLTAERYDEATHLRDILPLVQDKLLRALNDSPIPLAEAESLATKEAIVRTVRSALASIGGIDGVQDIALADYQSVPF
jgi:hypothetical protein